MSGYLGIDGDLLNAEKGLWTAREIAGQPHLWRETAVWMAQHREQVDAWISPQLAATRLRIVLSGAGSSSFVGQTLAPWLSMKLRRRVDAVATTDVVGRPDAYLGEDVPTLMVSFSRSGSSPESLASIELANELISECRHLILTCNSNGRLARVAGNNPEMLCVCLPKRSCDRGFAMTGSYTSMLLACAGIFSPDRERLNRAIRSSRVVLKSLAWQARALAKRPIERLVFLGSGCLRATAREASLKALELTNGAVVSLSDTPLGLRHGPKCVIDAATCVVLLGSANPYTAAYEVDLLREIVLDGRAQTAVVLYGDGARAERGAKAERSAHPFMPDALAQLKAGGRTEVVLVRTGDEARRGAETDDFWLSLPYVVFCQMLAFFKARDLGVTADDPCPSGEVNRVVQGVNIYPYPD